MDPLILPDATGIVMLLFAAALYGLLVGTASGWRALQRGMRHAPVQLALRDASGLSGRQRREAELRCALCSLKASCRAAPGGLPTECPNRKLFSRGA